LRRINDLARNTRGVKRRPTRTARQFLSHSTGASPAILLDFPSEMSDSVQSIASAPAIDPASSTRPLAKQQAALLRWLESSERSPNAPAIPAKTPHLLQTKSVHKLPAPHKVSTLRDALATNGLAALPDPLHRFPVQKVVRVQDLLRHET